MKQFISALIVFLTVISDPTLAAWNIVWSDEFDYNGLPAADKWGYDVGGSGWGNQELQYYTEKRLENARVENGVLIITAKKENYKNMNYTSARLITKNKGDWLYGRIEVAAKLPRGTGVWPAIWMLPTDWEYGEWPASGELDIMENVGFDPFVVHFNIHTEAYNHSIGTNKGDRTTLDDPHDTFNVYALEWFEDHVNFFANDDTIFTFENEKKSFREWPFDKRFHLLLNIAVGGTWGGQQGVDDDIFPQKCIIDYVRVYEQNSSVSVHNEYSFDRKPFSLRYINGKLHIRSTEPVVTLTIATIDGKKFLQRSVRSVNNTAVIALSKATGTFIVQLHGRRRTAIKKLIISP